MPVALRIGELAKNEGLTIKALAERAGVAYNTAHALYTSRATRIDLDTLDRMCAALGVEPGAIFVRYLAPEITGQKQENGGSYGADSDRATGARDRRAAGPL
jgi:DNA-binding Xre family transcriptional regulator